MVIVTRTLNNKIGYRSFKVKNIYIHHNKCAVTKNQNSCGLLGANPKI